MLLTAMTRFGTVILALTMVQVVLGVLQVAGS